jgi:hypothetical protein
MQNTPFRPNSGSLCVLLSLESKRIAIWGYGREGRAALVYLRHLLPQQQLTVLCNAAEAMEISASSRNVYRYV